MSLIEDPRLYDVVQRLAGPQVTARKLRVILAGAGGRRVLDVGAGTGSLARVLPPGVEYWALDSDPLKLRRLAHKVPGARRLLRSALDTGLEDGAADWTVCVAVAHHLDDAQLPQLIAELARVTGGRLVFVDPLWTGRLGPGRLLWGIDRGSYPRREATLVAALRERFELERFDRYRTLHEYLLCVGRPVRS